MKTFLTILAGFVSLLFATESQAMRWYSPSTGRWFSRDPIGEPATKNLYAFVDSDPIDFVDIDGRQKTKPTGTGSVRFVLAPKSPPRATSDCGGAESTVVWRLDNAKGKNGWVIQHVVYETDVKDCGDKPVPGKVGRGEYWEAWRVIDGEVWGEAQTISVLGGDDHFSLPDHGWGTKGKVKKTGYARFVENYNLTTPPWAYDMPQAGGLPTLRTPPDGWDDSGMLSHYLQAEFNCCCPAKKTVATGFPWQ